MFLAGTSASGTNAELLKMVTACRTLLPIPASEGILPVTHRCLHWVQASQTGMCFLTFLANADGTMHEPVQIHLKVLALKPH